MKAFRLIPFVLLAAFALSPVTASAGPPAEHRPQAPKLLKDVQIPEGVTIPTEEDYEEKVEKETTAANYEAELAKIEKDLAP